MSEAMTIIICEACNHQSPPSHSAVECLQRQVDNEIHDMIVVAGEVSVVYDTLTNGRLSKPNTLSQHIIDAVNEVQQQHEEEAIKDALEPIEDARESAEADAERLAEALDHALTDYDLSHAGLSGMCPFEDRQAVVSAREALRKHKELDAGH